jgi:hypothetical protein
MPAPDPATPHAKMGEDPDRARAQDHQSRAEQENMHATRLTFSTIGPRTYSALYG